MCACMLSGTAEGGADRSTGSADRDSMQKRLLFTLLPDSRDWL